MNGGSGDRDGERIERRSIRFTVMLQVYNEWQQIIIYYTIENDVLIQQGINILSTTE